ncbi:cell division protein FtsA [Candidatus Uhrbacteria bacterium]|nr:cell division protein FtsA [Candidatus Uhrbacteria bacterium]
MKSQDVIVGLDIGSRAVRVAVGQRQERPDGGALHIISAVEVPSEGVSKGTITSLEDAVSSVSKALEKAERMAGQPLVSAWVGIGGPHIIAQESKGVVGVARADGEIREEDVDRAIDAARAVATPANYEIIHVIPKSFTVDGQRGVKDPVGMNGIRLEVDAVIIQGLTSQMKNLTKSVYRTGIDIDDLVFSGLATAESLLTSRQKDLGVCVMNLGASTTSLVVFEEGDVLHTAVLPIGSDHITSDIAIGLRTSLETAEAIKLACGNAVSDGIGKKDEVRLSDYGAAEDEEVSRKYIVEIIEARVEEIFKKTDEELARVGRSGMLPSGIILAGGGAKLPGIIEVAKRQLRLPATLGSCIGVNTVIDRVRDPGFATAVGLVKWGEQIMATSSGNAWGNLFAKWRNVENVKKSLVGWLKSLRP